MALKFCFLNMTDRVLWCERHSSLDPDLELILLYLLLSNLFNVEETKNFGTWVTLWLWLEIFFFISFPNARHSNSSWGRGISTKQKSYTFLFTLMLLDHKCNLSGSKLDLICERNQPSQRLRKYKFKNDGDKSNTNPKAL